MPPRGYSRMMAERAATRKSSTTTKTRTPRGRTTASTPEDIEMSARAARVGRGRQTAAPAGRQGLGGSAMYSIQDMLNHPAVEWSRNMAKGPAQGKVDSITNDVHGKLAEQGITRGEDGTWGIDFGKNTAYRESKRSTSTMPSGPAATIPSGGGFPGPAKPPAPTPTGGQLPRQTGGGLPPGTLPRQGPVYTPGTATSTAATEPAKPAQPTLGLPPAGSAGGLNQMPQPQGKPPADMRTIPAPTTFTPTPGTSGSTVPSPGLGGGFPSSTTPNMGISNASLQAQPKPAQQPATLPRAVQPAPAPGTQTTSAAPTDPTVTQLPTLGAGPQQYSGYASPGSRVGQGSLPRQTPPGGGLTGSAADQPPPRNPAPAPAPSQIPTRNPQGMPQMPQRPQGMPGGFGQGNGSDLGGQIQASVQQMLAGMQRDMAQRNAGLGGLNGLGDRIAQSVQSRVGGVGRQGQQPGLPQAGGMPAGLQGLGQQIQQSVQSRIGGVGRQGQVPQGMPQPGGMTPPGGGMQPGPEPGNTTGAGGPPTGVPAPTGGGGTLGSYGNTSIDQWDAAFIAAGNAYGVDPTLLKAMAEIESGGNGNIPLDQCRDDGYGDGGSCGLMQIKPGIWGQSASTEDQIMLAAKILDDAVESGQYATHRDALFGIYFPMDDPNGTTQGSYGAKVDQLMGQMGPYQPATQTAPGNPGVPAPGPAAGPVQIDGAYQPHGANTEPKSIMTPESVGWMETLFPGAGQAAIANDYGYKNASGCPGCYDDYLNWDPNEHTGIDIPTNGSQPFNSVVNGEVVCVGGQGNTGDPTNSCGAYGDVGGGIGNLSIRTQDGAVVTYGHTRSNAVGLGQQVTTGTQIGASGDMNGYHVHLEVRLPVGPGGEYRIIDPNLYFNGYYCQYGFCPQ